MSSNIRVTKVCEYCNKDFEARKTTTKTCSDNCAKKLYKQRQRATKIEASNKEFIQIKRIPIEDIKAKEFLTVKETATLLNCSVRTAYRMVKQGSLKGVNLSQRLIRVRRTDFEKLFA
jgi:excisionase family DNA binding protein